MPIAQRGIIFEDREPVTRIHPNRMDIACFAGFTAVRGPVAAGPLPYFAEQGLRELGWLDSPYARPGARLLLDVPVSIDSWERFDQVFAWDERPVLQSQETAATALGAAVRSFFAEGGRHCFVVRAGDPWMAGQWLDEPAAATRIAQLIPGFPFTLQASAADRNSWRGMNHLFGLHEATFVSLPDLPELCAGTPADPKPQQVVVTRKEEWVECSDESPAPRNKRIIDYPAARSDRAGYARWSLALSFAARFLSRHRRDVQLVASLPRPLPEARIADLFQFLLDDSENGALGGTPDLRRDGIASAFVQLVYPWIQTRFSIDLPEGIEGPEGVLLGQLARNAFTQGAYRHAARVTPRTIVDLAPALSKQERLSLHNGETLQDRVSLFGFTPEGVRLLSDVTTAPGESYRPACINRLVSMLVRAAQREGEEALFESSGEQLWDELESRLGSLLDRLYVLGALRGATPDEAYSVRCDRSTMTQNDIDNGRLIVEIQFQAAFPIERITVRLSLEDGGEWRPVVMGEAA